MAMLEKDPVTFEKIAKENDTGIMWSANFSIGVNMYYQIIAKAGELINKYDEYDIWGTELHHNNKADSPSGTAKEIAKILLEKIDRKDEIIYDKLDRKINPNEIPSVMLKAYCIMVRVRKLGIDSVGSSQFIFFTL